ncbi:MAG: phosphoserine phosphatase SerB [Candidatus Liberibacter europaeus]|uniref:Phosphoserine phosphatase n=1 Tax=Candidatus Liberibacter europaeus TaxID=744859 RepID=A0A2T4VX12_9HYPH|nr:phosphoserine phosphatase SerB [Candidatus Liberibacter europaeus]PTL86311.1 MAG: phosphoserine phosphatase SerB [Candidatus Liberibacter europaeus]
MALVATLITNKSNPILSKSVVEKIMKAVNSTMFYWLANSIACDIILDSECIIDVCRQEILSIIANKPIDLVIHRTENRRKRMLIADMDSTMIQQECIDELADTIGIKEKVSSLTYLAMNGKIPFRDSIRERVSLLKGISIQTVLSIIEKRITYTPGGYEMVNTMKKNGAFTILVTGGFTVFADIISKKFGFDQYYANKLIDDNEKLTGKILDPIIDGKEKSKILLKATKMLNISPEDSIAVGDGKNDIDMIKMAGYGVAFHAKPIVIKQSKIHINHSDLESILYIQGYKQHEIVKPM